MRPHQQARGRSGCGRPRVGSRMATMSSDRARTIRCTAPGCVAFAVLPAAPSEQQAPQAAGWYDEHRRGGHPELEALVEDLEPNPMLN